MANAKRKYNVSHTRHARNGRVVYNYKIDAVSKRKSSKKPNKIVVQYAYDVRSDNASISIPVKNSDNVMREADYNKKVKGVDTLGKSNKPGDSEDNKKTQKTNTTVKPTSRKDFAKTGSDSDTASDCHGLTDKTSKHTLNRRVMMSKIAMALCLLVFSSASSFAFCKYFLTKGAEQQKLAKAEKTQKPEDLQAAEGTDEKKIPEDTIDSYKVAPDQPRVITIAKIGVRARILPMGLNPDTSIQAPTNINDTGWYRDSAKPGQIGTSLIDGHDLGVTSAGVFYKLKNLSTGDKISIEMGNGVTHTYSVTGKQVQHLADVDMSNVIAATDNHAARLVLITCDGKVMKENGKVTQDHRVIITAELIR